MTENAHVQTFREISKKTFHKDSKKKPCVHLVTFKAPESPEPGFSAKCQGFNSVKFKYIFANLVTSSVRSFSTQYAFDMLERRNASCKASW